MPAMSSRSNMCLISKSGACPPRHRAVTQSDPPRPRTSIMSRSNRLKQNAVGEWMVAQTVTPPTASCFTVRMTSLDV